MTGDAVTRGFLLARLAAGAVFTAAPGPAARSWLGTSPPTVTGEVPLRAVGARDVALSLGGLAAGRDGGDDRPWLSAAAVAELADPLAVLAVARRLPDRRWVVAVVGPALLAAVAGALGRRAAS